MQHSPSQVTRLQLVQLYVANLACAVITGLCVALPFIGAAFPIALAASCLSAAGCESPTALDQLVPVVGAVAWIAAAVQVGVLQIRTLHRMVIVRPSLKHRVR